MYVIKLISGNRSLFENSSVTAIRERTILELVQDEEEVLFFIGYFKSWWVRYRSKNQRQNPSH
jgi:hypothetical protein